jgi:hypothetical protein
MKHTTTDAFDTAFAMLSNMSPDIPPAMSIQHVTPSLVRIS